MAAAPRALSGVDTSAAPALTRKLAVDLVASMHAAIVRFQRALVLAGTTQELVDRAFLAYWRDVDHEIERSWDEAWIAGQRLWGRPREDGSQTQGLVADIRRQKAFAKRLAEDIFHGHTSAVGRQPINTRVTMYGHGVEAAFARGAVEGAPPGQLVYWRLGQCRHCPDCPVLAANSPYTAETLPTLPRAGHTQCVTRCRCHLAFRPAAGVAGQTVAPGLEGDELDRALAPPPQAPPGKRTPTEPERLLLRDLELRMMHANRAAAAATTDQARDRWLKTRKELNAEMIRVTRAAKIHHVPSFTTAEVLAWPWAGARNVDQMTHLRGIDGRTVHRAQKAAIDEALATARRALDGAMIMVPGTHPPVPSLVVRLDQRGGTVVELPPVGEAATAWPSVVAAESALGDLASPGDEIVVNLVGAGISATLDAHLSALRRLALARYDVEVGPCDDGWETPVTIAGTWISGPAGEVSRFLRDLADDVPAPGVAAAPWQEHA